MVNRFYTYNYIIDKHLLMPLFPPSDSFWVKCFKCKTVFYADITVYENVGSIPGPDGDRFYYPKCPICGESMRN